MGATAGDAEQQTAIASGHRERGDIYKRRSFLCEFAATKLDAAELYDGRPASHRRRNKTTGLFDEIAAGEDQKAPIEAFDQRFTSAGLSSIDFSLCSSVISVFLKTQTKVYATSHRLKSMLPVTD